MVMFALIKTNKEQIETFFPFHQMFNQLQTKLTNRPEEMRSTCYLFLLMKLVGYVLRPGSYLVFSAHDSHYGKVQNGHSLPVQYIPNLTIILK